MGGSGGRPPGKEKVWAVVRMALGLAQMMGAVVAAYLLLMTGANEWSLGAAAVTLLLTTVSVLLFRGR